MVKILIYTLLIVIAAVSAILYLDLINQPGYLLIAWRNVSFETSLFALFVAALVAGLLLWFVVRLASWLNPVRLIRRWRDAMRKAGNITRSHTTDGLIRFVQGDWKTAYRELEFGFREEQATVASYLAAAHAALALGDEDAWSISLDRAAEKFPEALSTINETRAELLWKIGQRDESLALLEQLERNGKVSSHLLVLQRQVYLELGDWDRLEALLPRLSEQGLVSDAEYEQLQRRLFSGKLAALAATVSRDQESASGTERDESPAAVVAGPHQKDHLQMDTKTPHEAEPEQPAEVGESAAGESSAVSSTEFAEASHGPITGTGSAEENVAASLEALKKSWQQAPPGYHTDVDLVTTYLDLLTGVGANQEAAEVIESTLDKVWDDVLIEKYGSGDFGDYPGRLLRARGWLKAHPENSRLLLALGRLALGNRSWDEARRYFEESCRLSPGPQVYAELARLTDSLGEADASRGYIEKFLATSASRLPELPLPGRAENREQ